MARNKKRTSGRKQWLFVAGILAGALILTMIVLHFGLALDVRLRGDETVQVECGTGWQDPGAEAIWSFLGMGTHSDVYADVSVSTQIPHTHILWYRARFLWIEKMVTRTVTVVDTTAPQIVLKTDPNGYTLPGQPYEEEGFTATDLCDGDVTHLVQSVQIEDKIIYTVTDSAGNTAQACRTIVYNDPDAPQITLLGDSVVILTAGKTFTEPGYAAVDNCDGDVTAAVQVHGSVNIHQPGTYLLTYVVKDSWGNEASATRTVVVEPLRQPDVVEPEGKVIYLTFDDGPSAHTDYLLDVLEKYNVKATFFVVDTAGSKYRSVLKRIVEEGHAIGVHSLTHQYSQIYASKEAFFADFNKMRQIIYDETGVWTNLMRFPGGSSNGSSKQYCEGIMTELTKAVTDMGYYYFDWNVSSGDASGNISADAVYQNVINGIQKKDVSVVLQHDLWKFSVDAVERIIIWGLENGYTFLPLDESSPVCHHTVTN